MKRAIHGLTGFLAVLLIAITLAAGAQPARKVPTIVVLSPTAGPSTIDDVFVQALQRLGWSVNQNLRLETRYWGGNVENLNRFVSEIVALNPAAVVIWGPQSTLAMKRATTQIPLILLSAFADPVEVGLIDNVARPGGNITGVTVFGTEIDTKRLQLLKEAVPNLRRVALLGSREQSVSKERKHKLMATAKQFNLEVLQEDVETPAGLEAAVLRLKRQGAQALYVWPTGITFSFGRQISEFAIANQLPSIHGYSESAMAGGLLSYAPPLNDVARRGAVYVDRILKGANPGEMPIEQPSNIEFIVNLKTAKALGLVIPQNMLLRADRTIE